jgi:hypothetical protein
MKKIELDKLTIELIASNIIFISLKEGVTIEDYDVAEVKKNNLKLTKGLDYAAILETGNYTSITKEARELMASSEMEVSRKATAFIITSLAQKLIGNFYLRVNKPNSLTKIFSEKENAIKWIETIINQ